MVSRKDCTGKTSTAENAASKSVPAKRRPSIEIEEVTNEDDATYSETPHNPRNIFEAAMDIDADAVEEEDVNEIIEDAEEDDEAELGLYRS